MEKIIDALLKLIPFATILQQIGFNADTSVSLSVLIDALLIFLFCKLIKIGYTRYKIYNTTKELRPYFTQYEIKSKQDSYISTKFQNNSPTIEEEPLFTHKYVSTSHLIPFFIKSVFPEKREKDKFYLILADSGMGKTTFLINLYLKCHSFFNFHRKYKMRYFPFGDDRILDLIKQIKPEEVKNTILLLDAFDEYKLLLPPDISDGLTDDERFKKELDKLILAVQDFREVIITSRTQYFPGQEEQPYELKIRRYDDSGYHTLAKLYLSPFNKKDIKRYLNKKYGVIKFWNFRKKRIATSIIYNTSKLMVRPMLISYIDYLVEYRDKFESTYDIYHILIKKWIEREANKRKHKIIDREKFIQDLYDFSYYVAIEIYSKRKELTLLHLEKESAFKISKNNDINLANYEITGQSLLTRDVNNNWKFAHKSILEYFLTSACLKDIDFAWKFEFNGMDMVRQFQIETRGWLSFSDFIMVQGGRVTHTLKLEPFNYDVHFENQEVEDFYILPFPIPYNLASSFIYESNPNKWRFNNSDEWLNANIIVGEYGSYESARREYLHNLYVEGISYFMASEFCLWLSNKIKIPIRLPKVEEFLYYILDRSHRSPYLNQYGFDPYFPDYIHYSWCYHQLNGKVDTKDGKNFTIDNPYYYNPLFNFKDEPSVFLHPSNVKQPGTQIFIAFDAKHLKKE